MASVKASHIISFTMSLIWVSDLYMGHVYILLALVGQVKLTPFIQQFLPREQDYTRTGAQPFPSVTCQFGLISLPKGKYGGELILS